MVNNILRSQMDKKILYPKGHMISDTIIAIIDKTPYQKRWQYFKKSLFVKGSKVICCWGGKQQITTYHKE